MSLVDSNEREPSWPLRLWRLDGRELLFERLLLLGDTVGEHQLHDIDAELVVRINHQTHFPPLRSMLLVSASEERADGRVSIARLPDRKRRRKAIPQHQQDECVKAGHDPISHPDEQ